MATLKNHPNSWLRDDAAAAFDKAEDDHGIFDVNSAGRTEAEQQRLIDRWNTGGASNRPPYLYQPAIPATSSNHVAHGGIAIDIGDWGRFAVVCGDYGFKHPYPGGDPVHFEFDGVDTSPQFDKATLDRQNFLNASRNAHLVPDGREGPLTKAEYKEYQTFLKGYGYSGEIDGIWGDLTQAAHAKYFSELHPPTPKPAPAPAAPASSGNKFGLDDVRGLQKIANLFTTGSHTAIDNDWGRLSEAGFDRFLLTKYGNSQNRGLARWLRARYQYVGNDVYGPNMKAALKRANKANFDQLR